MLKNLRTVGENGTKSLLTGPIIITCYTNHALDQFLDHVKEYTNEIVRLGGRTKEEFKKFSIAEVSRRKGNKNINRIVNYKK